MSTILEALKKAQKESDERLEAAIVRTEKSGLKRGLVAGLVVIGLALGLWGGYLVSVIPPAGKGEKASPAAVPDEAPPPEPLASSVPAAVEVSEAAPPVVRAVEIPAVPGADDEGEDGSRAIEVSGVVYDPVNPMAIINGRFVGVGDTVAGAQVLKIGRESIQIRSEDGTRTLMIEQ